MCIPFMNTGLLFTNVFSEQQGGSIKVEEDSSEDFTEDVIDFLYNIHE